MSNLTDIRVGGMKVEGAKALQRQLRRLPEKVQRKVLRQAHAAAGKIVLKSAKGKVVETTGLLKRSLGSKVRFFKRSGDWLVKIGPRRGFSSTFKGRKSVASRYAHLVEKGSPGQPARPFLRPALAETQAAVLKMIGDRAGVGIVREALKLRGKK